MTEESKTQKILYKNIMHAEMAPDLYDGPECDQVRARWYSECNGDMGGEYRDLIELDPATFPPGTVVIVSVPRCPECGQDVECCQSDEACEFDWEQWRDDKYQ